MPLSIALSVGEYVDGAAAACLLSIVASLHARIRRLELRLPQAKFRTKLAVFAGQSLPELRSVALRPAYPSNDREPQPQWQLASSPDGLDLSRANAPFLREVDLRDGWANPEYESGRYGVVPRALLLGSVRREKLEVIGLDLRPETAQRDVEALLRCMEAREIRLGACHFLRPGEKTGALTFASSDRRVSMLELETLVTGSLAVEMLAQIRAPSLQTLSTRIGPEMPVEETFVEFVLASDGCPRLTTLRLHLRHLETLYGTLRAVPTVENLELWLNVPDMQLRSLLNILDCDRHVLPALRRLALRIGGQFQLKDEQNIQSLVQFLWTRRCSPGRLSFFDIVNLNARRWTIPYSTFDAVVQDGLDVRMVLGNDQSWSLVQVHSFVD
ncbi:hypothetical protein MKEN_00980800 [Mycena kentingensis (nom. inval.)]|nr:hypothetical protein MKEN_00980800 [Mycena kentingensis (nom. inval.)]